MEVRVTWTYGEGDDQIIEHIGIDPRILVSIGSNDPGVRNSMEPSEVYGAIAELTEALPKPPGWDGDAAAK